MTESARCNLIEFVVHAAHDLEAFTIVDAL